MSDVIISPNMGLPVPIVSVEPGPTWASDINACMSAIDSHNHSLGNGVQINPAGLDINSDLPFGSNNATALRSTRYTAQISPLATASDIGCIYVAGVDMYYNDVNGNQIRITQSGSVTGATGTITGLPSGTASASYSAGVFTFQSAINTPAQINAGSYVLGQLVASGFAVTLQANAAQAANYALTMPVSLPAATYPVTLDSLGNLAATGTIAPITVNASGVVTGSTGLVAGSTSAPTFKMQRFTGSIASAGTTTLTVSGTVLGAIGMTSESGGATPTHAMPCAFAGVPDSAQIRCNFFTSGGPGQNNIVVKNGTGFGTNVYDVTIFYI